MNNSHALLQVLVMAIVMFLLRWLPFAVFSGKRMENKFISYLGKVLPFAAIGMLVVYCLRDISFVLSPFGIPETAALALVVLLHVLKRNTLLSIFGGTVFYMILIQFVF